MNSRARIRTWSGLSALVLACCVGCNSGSSSAPPPVASQPTPNVAPDAGQAAATAGDDAGVQPGMETANDGAESADGGMGMSFAGASAMPGAGGMAPGDLPENYEGMPGMQGMSGPGIPAMPGMVGMPGSGNAAGMESIGEPGMMGPGMMGMNGMGQPFVDPAPADDADYLTKAKYAFAIGKEAAAEQYAIAEILANDAEAANLLQKVRFAPAARKPTMTMRFAVGVELEAPAAISDYKPIGRTQFANMNGQGGGGIGEPMGMMSAGGGMPGGPGGGQKTLGDLTGRFGEELIKTFEATWDSGAFGTVFNEVETIVPVNRLNQNGNNRMMESFSGMPGMAGQGMGGMGLNDFGGEMQGGQPTGAPASESLHLRATPGKVITPGMTYLGTGKESELLGKAEAEGIDYVFMFAVVIKMNRSQSLQNDTKLRLVSVKDKKILGSTMTLNSNKVDREMAMKGDSDDVAKNIANLFRKVDAVKLQDMVQLKPEQAQARVKSLIEKKTKDVLPILLEIKLYHAQGWLNDEERDAAYMLTIPNGIAFASGSPADREFVLSPLLPGYK